VPVQPGERLLHHVFGRAGVVDEQHREPDHPHPVVAVEVGEVARLGARRTRLGRRDRRTARIEGAQAAERLFDRALRALVPAGVSTRIRTVVRGPARRATALESTADHPCSLKHGLWI
jgi:hypothetical protein